jgi:LPXTG-site transpeptidase (sortase) family protein
MITQQSAVRSELTQGKLISLGFLSIGIFLLLQVVLPLIYFQICAIEQKYSSGILITPGTKDTQVLGISVQTKDNFSAFVSTLKRETEASYKTFSLTVPKLKIEQAKVEVDSNDLSDGLVHLPGSALPGEKGNVFVSGHSALSQLFSFKKALFLNLTDLKKGDEIVVETAGAKFRYQVSEIKVVDPKATSVINAPEPLGRYISLMTCVPPGLNFKRLVVLGKMI